jgi:hypothetical protein
MAMSQAGCGGARNGQYFGDNKIADEYSSVSDYAQSFFNNGLCVMKYF